MMSVKLKNGLGSLARGGTSFSIWRGVISEACDLLQEGSPGGVTNHENLLRLLVPEYLSARFVAGNELW